jgi:preprotein translocase subunit YajC
VEGLASLLPFVLIAVVFWLLLIRPQRRRQMELARTQGSLEIGDEVMLGAGIVGRVASLDDGEFVGLETSPGVQMRVARGAVVRVLRPETDDEQDLTRPTDGPTDPTTGPTVP